MNAVHGRHSSTAVIRTPDQRLRVFVSSTLQELAPEREAAQQAIESLRLSAVMFELGARPHAAQALYRSYLAQSHIFIGLYWERYGWVAPEMDISGLEDEYRLADALPKLIYIKTPAPNREPGLTELLRSIKNADNVSYKYFETSEELGELIANDLALLLTERFEQSITVAAEPAHAGTQTGTLGQRLPALPAALIGREEEIATLGALVSQPQTRLITVTGPGGVGKTSLVLATVLALQEQFLDGIFWASLGTIRDPQLFLSTVAQALGVRERAGVTLLESVQSFLQTRELMLVADNFEQILDAAPMVRALLDAGERWTMVVTSRAPLQIRGEQEMPLLPLALPETKSTATLSNILENAAVKLFIERAMRVLPSFEVGEGNASTIAEIVRRVDGLPLAIELAAARIRSLSPQGILVRLDSRLRLLTGGARDLPERQQTLRNTIDWSYGLLDPSLQGLFRRLGVFVNGFTLNAAEVVCQPCYDGEVLDGIEALLDHNLLRRDQDVTAGQRYIMLHTVREFALEQLGEAGERAATRAAHAAAFADLSEAAWGRMFSGESEAWLDRLEADYGNLREALDWHFEHDQLKGAGRAMIVHLVWFWYRRGYLNEARVWYQRAMDETSDLSADATSALLWGHAGAVAMWQSDLATAAQLMDMSLQALQRMAPGDALGDVLFTRGVLAVNQGDLEKAVDVLQQALDVMKALGQRWFVAMIVLHLGNVALSRGDVQAAAEQMEEALALGREVGDEWIVASAINNFGEIARYQRQNDVAEAYYRESLALFESVGSIPDVARAYHSLAYVALEAGAHQEAARLLERGLDLYQQVGVKRGIVECLNGMAVLAWLSGRKETARRLAATATSELEVLGAGIWPADAHDIKRLAGFTGEASEEADLTVLPLKEALRIGSQLLRGNAHGAREASSGRTFSMSV